MVARHASETPARLIRRSKKRSSTTILLRLQCSPEIATSRLAFIKISKRTFLMSPPLVVALCTCGNRRKGLYLHPIGVDRDGNDVFLKDIWATLDEVREVLGAAFDPETYKTLYTEFAEQNPLWNDIASSTGSDYTSGTASRPTFRNRLILKTFRWRQGRFRTSQVHGLWRYSATRSRPTIFRPRERSRRTRPQDFIFSELVSNLRTSIRMDHVAATTR